jgi:hypothetical protein
MFIDQAIPYGTRPNSPAGAKPATADAAVLGLFGILRVVNLHWQSHHREQNPGPQAETRKAGGESSQTTLKAKSNNHVLVIITITHLVVMAAMTSRHDAHYHASV